MSNIKIFENKKIRTHWDNQKEDWYFSVVDVCAVFSESKTPRNYWSDLKRKLKQEGSELHENLVQLKLPSSDGKFYKTDVLNTKWLLRLVQSISSPKAEPFKVWLAQVGSERLEEIADPEKALQRGIEYYRKKGYPENWITQRLLSIKIRKELTAEWQEHGITEEKDYAILTNEMTKAWSGKTIREYKELKDLKKESLRDNMTDMELVLNMLAEVTTTTFSKQEQPQTFAESKKIAVRGGNVAGNARVDIEKQLGHSVISSLNANKKELLDTKRGKLLSNSKKSGEN
ncbi:MAG: Bro-N domain-containing protein [Clostridia bacterium]|nr:Bro-N domain-containing protein [Clostridia bacterium]